MILYFGDPRGALALLDLGLPLTGVVHGRKGGPGWLALLPRLKAAGTPRWTLPDLEDPEILAALAATKPELIVSAFYPRLIPQAVLDLAFGLNVHPSDLPRWRGPDPAFWTLRSGDAHAAICVHQLTVGLDEGPIVHREQVAIRPRESGGALAARLEARGAQLIAETTARWIQTGGWPTTPQTGEVTWAPLVDPDSLEIDWTCSAHEVDCLVRAAAPDPGAFTGLESELLVIFSGAPIEDGAFANLTPGTPFIYKDTFCLRCGEGSYALGRVQVGRKRMTGKDLARLVG